MHVMRTTSSLQFLSPLLHFAKPICSIAGWSTAVANKHAFYIWLTIWTTGFAQPHVHDWRRFSLFFSSFAIKCFFSIFNLPRQIVMLLFHWVLTHFLTS
jgi:hypothetical protein